MSQDIFSGSEMEVQTATDIMNDQNQNTTHKRNSLALGEHLKEAARKKGVVYCLDEHFKGIMLSVYFKNLRCDIIVYRNYLTSAKRLKLYSRLRSGFSELNGPVCSQDVSEALYRKY